MARADFVTGRVGHRPAWSQAGFVTGRLGHRPAWSQTGLVTGWLGHRWLGWTQRGRFHIKLRHLCHRQPVGTDFSQGSSPAQFRVPSRRLPLPMSVGSGVFYCPWSFRHRGRPNCAHKNLSGYVACQGAHWAHAGIGVADRFSQGRRGDGASLHPDMRSRELVGTGTCAPRARRGQLVGEANQQYSRNSVAAPRVVQPRARSHSCHQFACWGDAVVVSSTCRPAWSRPVRA